MEKENNTVFDPFKCFYEKFYKLTEKRGFAVSITRDLKTDILTVGLFKLDYVYKFEVTGVELMSLNSIESVVEMILSDAIFNALKEAEGR